MLEDLYIRNAPVDDCHSIHLWESAVENYIYSLTADKILRIDSTYNNASRHVIGNDYDEIMGNVALTELSSSALKVED